MLSSLPASARTDASRYDGTKELRAESSSHIKDNVDWKEFSESPFKF